MKPNGGLITRMERNLLQSVVGYQATHITRYDGFIAFCDEKGNGATIPIKDMFSFIKENEIYEIKELLK